MERIKIGITQGDINGIGYELILNTFEAEEMASLCTPIIYGSPKLPSQDARQSDQFPSGGGC